MSVVWPRSRLLRAAIVVLGACVLFVAAGYLLGPPLVRWQLARQLSRLLHRPVTVESVAVNPFRLAATIRGLTIRERDGSADAVRIEELFANVSSATFYRFAPVLDALTVTRPALSVVRFPDRTYNWQDLVEEFVLAPSKGPPKKFALYNIRVLDGSIRFDDRLVGRQHEVAELVVGVPFLSNLSSAIDVDVKPELSGRANGTPFALQGGTKPFKDTLETTLELKFEALPIPDYLDYSPVALPFALPSGKLDTDLTLVFAAAPGGASLAPARLLLRGTAALSGVALDLPPGKRLASLARLAVELDEVDLLAPSAAVRTIRLERPEATIVRRPDGTLNLQDALPALPARPEGDAGSSRRLAFSVGEIAVTGGSFRVRDDVPATAVHHRPGQRGADGARARQRAGDRGPRRVLVHDRRRGDVRADRDADARSARLERRGPPDGIPAAAALPVLRGAAQCRGDGRHARRGDRLHGVAEGRRARGDGRGDRGHRARRDRRHARRADAAAAPRARRDRRRHSRPRGADDRARRGARRRRDRVRAPRSRRHAARHADPQADSGGQGARHRERGAVADRREAHRRLRDRADLRGPAAGAAGDDAVVARLGRPGRDQQRGQEADPRAVARADRGRRSIRRPLRRVRLRRDALADAARRRGDGGGAADPAPAVRALRRPARPGHADRRRSDGEGGDQGRAPRRTRRARSRRGTAGRSWSRT